MSTTNSMNALVLERYNAPFTRTTIVQPAPRKGEVFVRIKANAGGGLQARFSRSTARQIRKERPANSH
jgi:hypothetical protein